MKTIMLIGLARSRVGLPPYVQHLGISPGLTLNVSGIETSVSFMVLRWTLKI